MIKILHIIQGLSLGGASRALIDLAKFSNTANSECQHTVMPLVRAETDPKALDRAIKCGLNTHLSYDRLTQISELNNHDIVQIHWWNNPELNSFLRESLPETRLISWFHVGGHISPHYITDELIDFFDVSIACSPYTYRSPAFKCLSYKKKKIKTSLIYGTVDLSPLNDVNPVCSNTFNVGYIGTVDYTKMHRNYITLCSKISIPNVKFIVAGSGIIEELRSDALRLNIEHKFDFKGYIDNVADVLSDLDVFGYPLCEETYAASEIILQECMYAGVPPVVFPYGGIQDLVIHDFNGLIANSEDEYCDLIKFLFENPRERERLSRNCKYYARETFGAVKMASAFNRIYEDIVYTSKKLRTFGLDSTESILTAKVELNDLVSRKKDEIESGSDIFINTLDVLTKSILNKSKYSKSETTKFEVDNEIKKGTLLFKLSGINRYTRYYADDPYLNLWNGISFFSLQRYSEAIFYLSEALNNSLKESRVYYYLAECCIAIGDNSTAFSAFQEALRINPECFAAKEMLARL